MMQLIKSTKRLNSVFYLALLISLVEPVMARDAEVLLRGKEQVKIARGSRLEVTDCNDLADGGKICSVKIIKTSETDLPCLTEEKPLTIW